MKTWRDLLMLYLTGDLTHEDRVLFEQFLGEDAACRAELDEWRTLAEIVRQETEARIESLPALPASFYQQLQVIHRSPNGRHNQAEKDQTMTTIAQPLPKTKFMPFTTLAAALVAVIVLAGALLFSRNPEPFTSEPLAGMQQEASATPTPAPTLVPTSTPLAAEFIPSLVPTVVAPDVWNAQTPLTAPIVSAPAALVQNLDLQPGYGTIVGLDISPDGSRLVVSRAAPGVYSLWLIILETGEELPLLVYDVELVSPQFNVDGTQVIVGTNSTAIFVLDVQAES